MGDGLLQKMQVASWFLEEEVNLADNLMRDLEELRNKYSDHLMQTSDFVGCLEIFKFQLLTDKHDDQQQDFE